MRSVAWAELQPCPSSPTEEAGLMQCNPGAVWTTAVVLTYPLLAARFSLCKLQDLATKPGCHQQCCAELALGGQLVSASTLCQKLTLAMLLQIGLDCKQNPEQLHFLVETKSWWHSTWSLREGPLDISFNHTWALVLGRTISLPETDKKVLDEHKDSSSITTFSLADISAAELESRCE